MTKEEAQEIVDKINPTTIIDDNWLDYLLLEIDLLRLRALQIITGYTSYNDLVKCWEGECISKFQTKEEPIEIYVGRTINFMSKYYLLISQDYNRVYYLDEDNDLNSFKITEVRHYLI